MVPNIDRESAVSRRLASLRILPSDAITQAIGTTPVTVDLGTFRESWVYLVARGTNADILEGDHTSPAMGAGEGYPLQDGAAEDFYVPRGEGPYLVTVRGAASGSFVALRKGSE